jgi:ABC-2 type transport system ATP-binding protein
VAISFTSLTKRYHAVTAVDDLSVDVQPGRITAFLGPNGSGKTTSMRALLGLTVPTAGTATIDGRRYRDVPHPMRVVGAVLDQGLHPNRTARRHLRILALQAGAPRGRVQEMLDLVGLTAAADRRVGGYSLGMRQRLALGGALIGDPATLVLDEPFNGLDPDGIWMMRAFLRTFADDGGTVFLSSHLLAEVANTADDAVIINKGRLVKAGTVRELVRPGGVAVTTRDASALSAALVEAGATVDRTGPDGLLVHGADGATIAAAALRAGALVTGLQEQSADLETVFQALVHDSEFPDPAPSASGAPMVRQAGPTDHQEVPS